ncbi:hypothetical protein CDV31_002597 [Fusarium ambrosium]|uniref:Uncharacterized protein n=1 Tax=Fusarium ambrosium TaxID=131363 RepID=A0A428UW21_9HYPO|nr:hypothetical protein CDV31_002597 [Fusarium ambrosium]
MSSLGRLQAALAAATNEVTVAAANINFDFTLVKYEAPKEFQPLKGFLTTTRKHDAETGKTHVIARRLGALFDGICPETPALIKAYGARVSEISKAATEKESRDYSKSIFAAYVGVDATSIWAAATSSKPAIHVHLLACMLAEIWDAPKAVSIWVELVEKRRQDIAQRLEQGEQIHFGLASAAVQQEISRDQLAAWDASARAWIQTAKSVKNKQDTQLRVILRSVHYAVNAIDALYASVTDAWKLALETTENLILGMPQEAHNGAAILGLVAWHIYPDMHVYGTKNVVVPMNDELVAHGGVLSLVNSEPRQPNNRGVSWSLCLSHLTFYGPPARTEQTLEKDPCYGCFRLKDANLASQLSPQVGMEIIAHLMCGYNIHKSSMPTNVMGISFEDSIFVPSKIVHDPAREYEASHVTQILGNIGCPGLVMLTSPANPMLAPLDEAKWRIYNMHEFNGKPEDMLDATSLHLSFTNWSHSGGPSGMQGVEALLVEAVVSIRDSGQWVGDVDATTALGCDMIHQVKPNPNCNHEPHSLPTTAMISIECWDELRICPEGLAVVRASGNWVARLAATAYLVQKILLGELRRRRIFVCPDNVCWACIELQGLPDIYVY